MFGALFRKVETEEQITLRHAEALYALALEQTRKPVFYTDYGVPDTFDGRFDLLLLHIFLILNFLMKTSDHEELSQALFDVNFRDMDQTLREMGIGDMGVPKHMRRMMQAFNGRMHAYQLALEPETVKTVVNLDGVLETDLGSALRRNLYATATDVTDQHIERMVSYVEHNRARKFLDVFEEV